MKFLLTSPSIHASILSVLKIRGSEKIRLLHRASYLADSMDKQFEQISGANKGFDPRHDTLSRMRSYIERNITEKKPLGGFNYKPLKTETETAAELLGFIDHLESQFRTMCGDKTTYELDDETHGVDCRYQNLMELRYAVMERLEPNVRMIRPEYRRVHSSAESKTSAKAAA